MIHPKSVYMLLTMAVQDCPKIKAFKGIRVPKTQAAELDMSCDDCMAREYLIDECPAVL